MKLFNEKRERKNKRDSQKAFQNWNIFEDVFQITIDDLKQIVSKKDEAIQNFLLEINEY